MKYIGEGRCCCPMARDVHQHLGAVDFRLPEISERQCHQGISSASFDPRSVKSGSLGGTETGVEMTWAMEAAAASSPWLWCGGIMRSTALLATGSSTFEISCL